METTVQTRPGPVTFVGVVLYIKAIVAVVVGVALLVERNDDDFLGVTGRTSDYLLGTAIGEFILAALLFFAAAAIMNGSKWARLLVAIVVGFRIAVAVYWMIAHIGGGLQWNALLYVGMGMFVLWALYGNERSQEYFEGYA